MDKKRWMIVVAFAAVAVLAACTPTGGEPENAADTNSAESTGDEPRNTEMEPAALEGVRMQVGHARDHRALGDGRILGPRCAGLHLRELARCIPGQQDILGPAGGKQRVWRMERLARGCEPSSCPLPEGEGKYTRPCRTTAWIGRWPNQ